MIAASGITPLYAQNINLLSVNPNNASPGAVVSISASGFTPGVSVPPVTVTLTGGSVLTAAGTVVGTGGLRTINFNAPTGTPANYALTVSGAVTSTNSLAFQLRPAASFSLAPNTGGTGTTLQVTITGSNTTFPNGTTARFGPGISVGGAPENQFGPVVVQPNGTAIANLTINVSAAVGLRTVSVIGLDSINQSNAFAVTIANRPLTLLSVNPSVGNPGRTISVAANGFVGVAPPITVTLTPTFGGPPIDVPAISVVGAGGVRTVNFDIPAVITAGIYNVTLSGAGYRSANTLPLTVNVPPIFSLNPNSGATGSTAQVVITGTNTSFPSGTTARFGPGISVGGQPEGQFGPVAPQPNGTAIATIVISPSATLGGRTVDVNGADALSQANAFTVTSGVLTLTLLSVNPSSGNPGTAVSISASGFVGVAPPMTVTLTPSGGGAPINVPAISVVGSSGVRSVIFNVPAAIATGPYSVTLTGTGYVSGNSLPFTVLAPPSFSLSPTSGAQNTALQVLITGTNTTFASAATARFGSGISVGGAPQDAFGPLEILSPNTARATLSIAAGATLGGRTVEVTSSDVMSQANAFQVTGASLILSATPNSGLQNQTLNVNIIGSNTNFNSGSTVSFGPGIAINNVVFNGATNLTANLSIQSSATPGARDVTVTTNGVPLTGTGLFAVAAAQPQITNVSPNSGPQGQSLSVTVTGLNTNFTAASTVSFGPGISVSSVGFNSASSLTANIAIDAGATPGLRDVTVLTAGLPVTGTGLFSVVATPRILSAAPNVATQGQSLAVIISGQNTSFSAASSVSFGAAITVDSVQVSSATTVTANIRIDALATLGSRNVTVTTDGTPLIGTNLFTVLQAPPQQISGVAPSTGQQGQTLNVLITGQGTNFSSGSTVSFGAGVTVNSVSFNSVTSLGVSITIDSSATPGPRDVTVTTQGSAVTGVGLFTVTAIPGQILSVAPTSGAQGQSLSVTITGSNTNFSAASTVSFGVGITVNSVTVSSAVSLTANIAIAAAAAVGARDVTVTTSGTAVTGVGLFTVTASPAQITSVSPATAQQNQTLNVTITGTNTTFDAASTVSFGSGVTVNSVTFAGPTSLIVAISVAPAATPGPRDVTVTTNGIPLTGPGLFSVTPSPAQITSINPNSAQQGQTLNATITGSNTSFTAASTVSLGPGITVNSVIFSSPTVLTANITLAANATLGPRDVIVTTAGVVVSGGNLFTVTASNPAITQVSPVSGAQGQTIPVNITGSNTSFSAASTVSFGSGITVNAVTFNSATSLTANITIAPTATVGSRDVTVTTASVPLTGTGLFMVTEAPPQQLISVSPPTAMQAETLSVTITGSSTNFGAGSRVGFGSNILVNSQVVNSATSVSANITIDGDAPIGSRDVHVTTSGVTLTGTGLFSITPSPARITTVSPATGPQGQSTSVTITGWNTNFSASSTVNFGAGITINSISVGGPTSLTVALTIAPNATLGARDVTVTTGGIPITANDAFVVTGTPEITLVSPGIGQPGQILTVAIFASNTNFGPGSIVSFGAGITVNSFEVFGATTLSADITIAANAVAGLRDVIVTTNGTSVIGTGLFTVASGAGQITGVAPNSGQQGQGLTVTITGANVDFKNTSIVSLGAGITVHSITLISATSLLAEITIQTDAEIGLRTVVVTTGPQVVSLNGGFSVTRRGQSGPLTCRTGAGVPPLLRAEGYTELTGDILIVCTGGNPGQTSAVNVQLFLNTQITSRVISGQSEALLIVDEPEAARQFYRAVPAQQGENSVVWTNVRVTAPGAAGQTVIRIVNVRANASALGVSTSLVPAQVLAFLSASPSQSLPLSSPQQTVGYVQPGLAFEVTNCNNSALTSISMAQCIGENSSGTRDLINGTTGSMQFAVRFTEGFQTAFKPQLAPGQMPSVPGVVYHSESGFLNTPTMPYSVGGADSGTRLVAKFTNIPAGARLFVTTTPSIGSTAGLNAALIRTGPNGDGAVAQPGNPVGVTGTATLFCPLTNVAGFAAAEIPVINGSAMAAWEVIATNAAALEAAVFGVAVVYAPDVPNRLPGLGQTSVAGSFGPFYPSDAGRMSASLPIPRFIDNPLRRDAFRIDSCVTNLLFPFVTNQAGFDTGIAVANSSRDPFDGTQRSQAGTCTVNYYGTTLSGPAPPPQTTTSVVAAGSTMAFVLSSGGSHGIPAAPGFQGYLVIRCDFRYAHGFAFVTDGPIGSARVAEGYLGLVMDAGIPTRGSLSESLSQ